jgi:Tfp pilus assembly protein PilO
MYAKRNRLTIFAVLLLLSGLGYLWYRSAAKDLARVKAQNQSLTQNLRGAEEVTETLEYVKAERDSLQRRWRGAPKKLLNAEEPAFSLSYINWLINQHGLDLDFDFYLNEKKAHTDYTAFSYTLNGEGDYRNICALVWYMTRSPLLYQIKSVTYCRSENDRTLLNFVIQFEGYTVNKDWEVQSEVVMTSPPLDWYSEFEYDAFASMAPAAIEAKPAAVIVTAPAPSKPAESPDLFDLEGASLLAIVGDKAYVRARNGKVVTMSIGYQVKNGRLTRVDARANQVEFIIETGGSSRIVPMKIEYN